MENNNSQLKMFESLNESQKQAVTAPLNGSFQILAGPGTGKTKVLTSRIAYLIKNGISPNRLIVISFTRKAANEMKERINKLIGENVAKKLNIGTFHYVCLRLLRKHRRLISLSIKFSVIDQDMALELFKEALKEYKQEINVRSHECRIVLGMISKLKANNMTIDDVANSEDLCYFYSTSGRKIRVKLKDVYAVYQNALINSCVLDFDDILMYTVKLVKENPSIIENIHTVLVDEFQDTNKIQYLLCTLFAQKSRNLTAVGDPDQSIYGFRSAYPKAFNEMKDEFDCKIFFLDINYRSAPSVVNVSHQVIKKNENRTLQPKPQTSNQQDFNTYLIKTISSHDEALWCARNIWRMINCSNGLLKPKDFAILSRTLKPLEKFELAAFEHMLPCKNVRILSIFERKELSILIDYLRIMHNPYDIISGKRTINVPKRGIGKVTLEKIIEQAVEEDISFFDSVEKFSKSSRSSIGMKNYIEIINKAKKIVSANPGSMAIIRVLEFLVDALELEKYVSTLDKSEERWQRVEKFLKLDFNKLFANESESDEDENDEEGDDIIGKFLSYLSLLSGSVEEVSTKEESINAVALSTIHSSKGLEWPIVFVIGLSNSETRGMPPKFSDDHEEERRILYVAMTRAMCGLFLTVPLAEESYGISGLATVKLDITSLIPLEARNLFKNNFKLTTDFYKAISSFLKRNCDDPSKIKRLIETCQKDDCIGCLSQDVRRITNEANIDNDREDAVVEINKRNYLNRSNGNNMMSSTKRKKENKHNDEGTVKLISNKKNRFIKKEFSNVSSFPGFCSARTLANIDINSGVTSEATENN